MLTLDHIHYSWRPDQPLFDDLSFSVAAGETVFINGPSGCGKSTLLSLIGGVLQPQSGTVRLLDQDVSALSNTARDRMRADHIGFVFQSFNLLPYLNTRDNVILPCRFSASRRQRVVDKGRSPEKEADRLLERLGLGDQRADQPVSELSVGQQQRVALARALIGAPELVIADEPTSALDEGRQNDFMQLLFNEISRAGSSLVFVSHDNRLQSQFDRVVNLNSEVAS